MSSAFLFTKICTFVRFSTLIQRNVQRSNHFVAEVLINPLLRLCFVRKRLYRAKQKYFGYKYENETFEIILVESQIDITLPK